jgi:hypothetical protein
MLKMLKHSGAAGRFFSNLTEEACNSAEIIGNSGHRKCSQISTGVCLMN